MTEPRTSRLLDEHGNPRKHLSAAPDWTNPNIGMVALITASWHAYGDESLEVSKQGLFKLGLRTGQYMLDEGLVPKDASPTDWGRFTLDLMDLTGFHDYEELLSTPERYEFRVTKYPYTEPYKYLDVPRDICDIPGWWDRGCIATINPRLVMDKPKCFNWGDGECRWVFTLRSAAEA